MPSPNVHLPLGSPELQRALHGAAPEAYRPIAVQRDVVELALGAAPDRPSSAKVWFMAGRAISLTATATPAIAAVLASLLLGVVVDWGVAALGLLGALLLQLGVNLDNDHGDHVRLIDLPGTFGGSGVLQRGWLSPVAVRRAALGLYALGFLAGLPAFLRAPGPMLVVGLLAVVGGVGYSGKPFGLKYKALGDLAVLLLCGPALTLGMGIAATGALQVALVPLGLAFGLLAIGILHTNNLQDVAVDEARGAKTFAGVIGARASRLYLAGLYVGASLAWAATAVMLSLPIWAALIPVIAWLPTAKLLQRVFTADDPHSPSLALLRIEAAQLHLMWGVLFIASLALGLA